MRTATPDRSNQPATRLVLVFSVDGGLLATLVDVVKKAVGVESCTLCHATYSAMGRKRAWKDCVRSLGIPVDELHRDEVPRDWKIRDEDLPCVLVERAGERVVLVDRAAIAACAGDPERLAEAVRQGLDARERAF